MNAGINAYIMRLFKCSIPVSFDLYFHVRKAEVTICGYFIQQQDHVDSIIISLVSHENEPWFYYK